MKVAIISSEVAPFSKTGGLADVAGALPDALKKTSGCDIRVISPFYRMVRKGRFGIRKVKTVKGVKGFSDTGPFELFEAQKGGIRYFFIRKDRYFDREDLYGTSTGDYADSAQRFSFFSRAVLAALPEMGFYPDVIHANDWHTGLMPLYKEARCAKSNPLKKSKVLFTIHNLAYEGRFPARQMKGIGLPEELIESLRCRGRFSFIKAGILYADAVSTVSKRYAKEIATPQYGNGLNHVLLKSGKKVYGVLNGADYSRWDPKTDRLIPVNYDAGTLEKKSICKAALIKRMKLEIPLYAPLLGFVGRLAWQKGIDIIVEALEEIVKAGAGFVLLGTGEGKYEKALKEAGRAYRRKVGVTIGFDEKLAHMIEAGVDMFVMPSRYEPCGLNQMYSLKYAAIPIVRATGGLDDTIVDFSSHPKKGNGFKFREMRVRRFFKAIKRALRVFDDKEEWIKLQRRGMAAEFSWRRSAREYAAIYQKLVRQK